MFIYETRNLYNSNNEGPFKGLVAKAGKSQLPAASSETVLFLGNKDDEPISLNQEFVVGNKSDEPPVAESKFYRVSYDGQGQVVSYEQLATNYTAQESDYPQNLLFNLIEDVSGFDGFTESRVDGAYVGLPEEGETSITASTSSGFDLEVKQSTAANGYLQLTVGLPGSSSDVPEGFFDEEPIPGGDKWTNVTINCSGSTFTYKAGQTAGSSS